LRATKQPSAEHLNEVIDALVPIVRQAGAAIMRIYRRPGHGVQTKADKSPVTDADLASHMMITDALARLTPDWPVVSEEDIEPILQTGLLPPLFWLLDPLDGTREFIARTDEFSVSLGLVAGDAPCAGMIFGPVDDLIYAGGPLLGARRCRGSQGWTAIASRHRPADGGIMISSRRSASRPGDAHFSDHVFLGSALKFGRLAEGNADIYLRNGTTMEWDTCAGQAILEGAGGRVVSLVDHMPLRYGKPGFRNPGFVASGVVRV
jgi:3'(2'), 5'-bisphosphate nucleotidase